jgi:hypothetical protein
MQQSSGKLHGKCSSRNKAINDEEEQTLSATAEELFKSNCSVTYLLYSHYPLALQHLVRTH